MDRENRAASVRPRPARSIRLVVNGIHAKSGGGLTYIRQLIPKLAAFPDLELHLFLHRDQYAQYYPIDENIRVHLFNFSHRRIPTLLWEQIVIPILTRQMGADIVFSPANYGPLFARNHVILLRNAISVFRVEGSVTGKFYWLGVALATLASVLTARRALAVSEFAQRELTFGMSNLLGDKVRIVHHGTAPRRIDDRRSNRESPNLLAVSDIYVQKNYHTLLRALAILQKRFPDLHLTVAGQTIDQRYMARIRTQMTELDLDGKVSFLGHVEAGDLTRLYAQCRVFVFPSLVETFGNPLLEAMAAGAPIACSNSAAVPEIVGDTGVMFDPKNADDMADKIATLLEDDALRAELSRRARRRARKFTWESTALRTRKEFCEIMGAEVGPAEQRP